MFIANSNSPVKNTSYKVVLPFYAYAALSFLVASIMIMSDSLILTQHYFHPKTLAVTHIMALGWGTMIILGASHQLVPVLIEGKLYSNVLAILSFILAAAGIPLLAYSFYHFSFNWMAQVSAILINLAVGCYLMNLYASMHASKKENVHAIFVFAATVWLFVTTLLGLLLVYNFTGSVLRNDSVYYLSLHAHIGFIGWFLLLVIGVGSRLIPMFLISKYEHPKLLWWVFTLINAGLIALGIVFLSSFTARFYLVPMVLISAGLILFFRYIYKSYAERIRKKVDAQVKISLISVAMMAVPVVVLFCIITFISFYSSNTRLALLYGFTIFFGWLTAIILGMTFKTLPFIVWNKVYHKVAGLGKTPNPKDLFSNQLFVITGIAYLVAFVLFVAGILSANKFLLNAGAFFLLFTAVCYNLNLFKILFHKRSIK